jgi:hypothetical protein
MRCPSCEFENPEGLKFCNECGTTLKRRCTQCGFENVPQAKFCGECGTALKGKETENRRIVESGKKAQDAPSHHPFRPWTLDPEP